MKKILFVTSEAYPLIKTGGLADVSGSLPLALTSRGHDVRILMPAYGDVMAELEDVHTVVRIKQANSVIEIAEAHLPGSAVRVWLAAQPGAFDRRGNPYLGADGQPWADNAERFALLARIAVEIGLNRVGFRWKPDVVHCNDWQTGLIPPLLEDEPGRPATVFTIHNLAYQGVFPKETFKRLGLPQRFWSYQALEFYDQLCFLKGGLVFADRINTVSPSYAAEIQGDEFGCGMQGLLRQRADRLSGILNGIDTDAWNPAADPWIPHPYSETDLAAKALNKAALRRRLGLDETSADALFASIGRLVQQKGIDLVIDILPELVKLPLQLVILGSGDKRYEQTLGQWAKLYPDRIAVSLGYDEPLSHLIEAGADVFLMPSRFEPCGLNQMYSQRYGTVPIVHQVGGLADTVADVNATNRSCGSASGVVFRNASETELLGAVQRTLGFYREPELWAKLQRAGMTRDFSWSNSAAQYEALYKLAIGDRNRTAKSMLSLSANA
jgi:starch synthase